MVVELATGIRSFPNGISSPLNQIINILNFLHFPLPPHKDNNSLNPIEESHKLSSSSSEFIIIHPRAVDTYFLTQQVHSLRGGAGGERGPSGSTSEIQTQQSSSPTSGQVPENYKLFWERAALGNDMFTLPGFASPSGINPVGTLLPTRLSRTHDYHASLVGVCCK